MRFFSGWIAIGLIAANVAHADFAPNQLLVRVKPEASSEQRRSFEALLKEVSAKVVYEYRLVPGLMHIALAETASLRKVEARIAGLPAVQYASKNIYRHPVAAPVGRSSALEPPLPAFQPRPIGWKLEPGYAGNYGILQNLVDEVWKQLEFYGAPETVIAVIDTGIDYTHPDLVANLWRNPGEIPDNGIDDDGDGLVDDVIGWDFTDGDNRPYDGYGHGTHVAGIAAAVGGNGIGIAGHCARCSIMDLRFIGASSGTDADAIRALEYAVAHGADVVNASWGSHEPDPALEDALRATSAAGLLIAVAAGNDGEDLRHSEFYPAKYRVPGALTVAALYDGQISIPSWSNYGVDFVQTAAAGNEVLSTLAGGGYGPMSGTSMASPAVAGDLALIRSFRPELSNAAIVERLGKHVLADPDSRIKTGFGGRPDVLETLKSF